MNSIKEDLERFFKWTEEWQMKFNADKCKVMHLDRNNIGGKYLLEGVELESILKENIWLYTWTIILK